MTTKNMVKRLIARKDDPRLTDESRAEIEERLAWLDETAQMMRDHGYKDALAGVSEGRDMLLEAVDGERLFNRNGEEDRGIEDSVRWNVTTSLISVLEQLAGPAPDDFTTFCDLKEQYED